MYLSSCPLALSCSYLVEVDGYKRLGVGARWSGGAQVLSRVGILHQDPRQDALGQQLQPPLLALLKVVGCLARLDGGRLLGLQCTRTRTGLKWRRGCKISSCNSYSGYSVPANLLRPQRPPSPSARAQTHPSCAALPHCAAPPPRGSAALAARHAWRVLCVCGQCVCVQLLVHLLPASATHPSISIPEPTPPWRCQLTWPSSVLPSAPAAPLAGVHHKERRTVRNGNAGH